MPFVGPSLRTSSVASTGRGSSYAGWASGVGADIMATRAGSGSGAAAAVTLAGAALAAAAGCETAGVGEAASTSA